MTFWCHCQCSRTEENANYRGSYEVYFASFVSEFLRTFPIAFLFLDRLGIYVHLYFLLTASCSLGLHNASSLLTFLWICVVFLSNFPPFEKGRRSTRDVTSGMADSQCEDRKGQFSKSYFRNLRHFSFIFSNCYDCLQGKRHINTVFYRLVLWSRFYGSWSLRYTAAFRVMTFDVIKVSYFQSTIFHSTLTLLCAMQSAVCNKSQENLFWNRYIYNLLLNTDRHLDLQTLGNSTVFQ